MPITDLFFHTPVPIFLLPFLDKYAIFIGRLVEDY